MKRYFPFLVTLLVAVSLAGCKSLLKKRLPVAAASDSAPVAVAPPPPPAASAAPVASVATAPGSDDAAVPAPEDFEDEAFEKVTAQNFRAEFAKLSKDVAQTK